MWIFFFFFWVMHGHCLILPIITISVRGHCGHDRMVVGFTTTYAIGAYHNLSCEFKSRSWRGVLDATLCEKVCQ